MLVIVSPEATSMCRGDKHHVVCNPGARYHFATDFLHQQPQQTDQINHAMQFSGTALELHQSAGFKLYLQQGVQVFVILR